MIRADLSAKMESKDALPKKSSGPECARKSLLYFLKTLYDYLKGPRIVCVEWIIEKSRIEESPATKQLLGLLTDLQMFHVYDQLMMIRS